jgi:large subunit ribosomal protein L15
VKLNEIKVPSKATTRAPKRRGRGPASGLGGTSGKGHKGQKARAGKKLRRGFEGGQMPLVRRLPKRGFFNKFRTIYEVVNVADIEKKGLTGELTPESLRLSGLVKKAKRRVKILGDGELTRAITVKVHAVSKSAREKIEKAGGTVELLS